MAEPVDDQAESPVPADVLRISFRKWAWTPFYAKIWWGLSVIFWLSLILSHRMEALSWMRESVLPGFLAVLFHPFIMLMILGFGTVERWWHSQARGEWQPVDTNDFFDRSSLGPSGLPYYVDPLDPRSGSMWIGSPMNTHNRRNFNQEP
ncbi:hypothetical protein [Sphingobium sp. WCS2017Hpa-17]|uniref:hypothetical protein n=1 Tax=Sphingobium sp. WCS2017Hpa-17 TaxID=3073638 RepID=UPI00288BEFB9|nr:hypothetical protein [Sphingobium sp. WCS2017Hpa-17]